MAVGDVIRWTSRRGRNLEFDEIEAGTATVWLNNRHGNYDPTNGASPYSGKLLPLKQFVITAAKPTAPSTWVRQFTGYVEDWDYERRGPRHEVAVVQVVDGFEPLARAKLSPSMTGGTYFATQQVDDRMRAVLADVGWPSQRTQINTGNVDLQPVLYEPGTSALEALRDAAEAEFPGVGLIFIRKDGYFRFLGRCARFDPLNPQYDAALWRLGDAEAREADPTLLPIFDLKWRYEKEHIYNSAVVLPSGVEMQDTYVVENATSIARRGRRSLDPITDLLIQAGTSTGNTAIEECQNVFAKYYVDNYHQPYVRPYGLTVSASFADASATFLEPLWNFILNVELGDVIELHTEHPGGGGFNALQYFVEGISNDVRPPYKWRQTIDLSPRARYSGGPYLGC
jgi:hypothetical protein